MRAFCRIRAKMGYPMQDIPSGSGLPSPGCPGDRTEPNTGIHSFEQSTGTSVDALTSLQTRIMMPLMRTTVNIDDDILQRLRKEAERTRAPFGATVNRVLRLGLERLQPESARPPYPCPTFSMGFPPLPNLDKALALAALLEDEEAPGS